jgi:hypothetical protein
MPDHFLAIDSEVVNQLLPLGDSIIGALVTLATAAITYGVGRARARAELDNIKAEKKSIEAASGVSTAEAAQVISEAAAATVQPLLDRIREQRQEIRFLTEKNVEYRDTIDQVRTHAAKLAAENELMKNKFKLQGEKIPELPTEETK